MRNARAVLALLAGLLALAVLAGAAAARLLVEIGFEGALAVPVAALLALLALSLARRARDEYQRTLGRAGGRVLVAVARAVAVLALLLAVTAALALGVFVLLVVLQDR